MCLSGGPTGSPLCVGHSSTDALSADPANDALNYSSQEWLSPGQSQVHTIYNNGDETVLDTDTHEYVAYNAAHDTVTTLTSDSTIPGAIPSASPAASTPFPLAGALGLTSKVADPSYFENLYHEAQVGGEHTVGRITVTAAQLVGQTTIGGESVYELRFDFQFAATANPPAYDPCGSKVCTRPDQETLLYLDSQTLMPVRSVVMTVNTNDRPGFPPGTTVSDVTDFTVQSLPDTPSNESLLQMSPHPGATQVQETYTPGKGTVVSTGASSASGLTSQAGTTSSTGSTGATTATGTTGTTGATGTSKSGASGAGGATAAN